MEKKKLNVKAIKQMCSVPGCTNRGSYTIARTRYFGGVNICGDCIRESVALIAPTTLPTLRELLLDERFKEELKKAIEDGIQERLAHANNGNDTPDDTLLNLRTDDTETSGSDNDSRQEGHHAEQANPQTNKYICSKCGRECGSQIGLSSHEKACGAK